jgi:hypothetical protein
VPLLRHISVESGSSRLELRRFFNGFNNQTEDLLEQKGQDGWFELGTYL